MAPISADDHADTQRRLREIHEKPLTDAKKAIGKIPAGRYDPDEIQELIRMLERIKYAS